MKVEMINGLAFVDGEIFSEKYHGISRREIAEQMGAWDYPFLSKGVYTHDDGYVIDTPIDWVIPVGWRELSTHADRNAAMDHMIRNGTEEEIEIVKKHYIACLTYEFKNRNDLVNFYEDVWSGNEQLGMEEHPVLGMVEVQPRWLEAIMKRWPKPRKEKADIGLDPMIASAYGEKAEEKILEQQKKIEEKEKKKAELKAINIENQINLFSLVRE